MPQTINDEIASSVRAELARIKKSGRQLAAEMSWPYMHFMRRLSGQVPFSAAELGRIARHLDVPVERFYAQQQPAGQAS